MVATVPVPVPGAKFGLELVLAPPYPLSIKAWEGGGTAVLGLRVDIAKEGRRRGRRRRNDGGRRAEVREGKGWSQLMQRLLL